ncbi:MAG: hypothetical protein ACRBBW_06905 [Cellvibrionaceae bacterium]
MRSKRLSAQIPALAALLLAVIWGLFAHRYYGPTTPLSPAEVDRYVAGVKTMFVTAGVPDADGNVDLDTILQQVRAFAETDDGKPIYMINLMKWRDAPLFRPDTPMVAGMSVQDADLAYNQGLLYELAKNASHTAYLSSTHDNVINYGFSSQDVDHWGEIGIFRYSSRRDFFNMLVSDSYASIVYFKLASMGRIAITPSHPHGLLFNPMPNLPVLLAFLFIVGYLVLLLVLNRTTTSE